ncbi:unnamed protein product [Arctogadus glacialis]
MWRRMRGLNQGDDRLRLRGLKPSDVRPALRGIDDQAALRRSGRAPEEHGKAMEGENMERLVALYSSPDPGL